MLRTRTGRRETAHHRQLGALCCVVSHQTDSQHPLLSSHVSPNLESKSTCFPDSQQPAGRRSETQPVRCPWPRSGAGASTRWLHSCTAQRPGGLCTAGQRPVTRRGESRRKWVVTSRSRLPGTAVVPASADPEPPPASCPRETWCCLSRSETCARVRSGGPARTHHSL